MLKLSSHITIGTVAFDFVCDVNIKESVNTLTDTCVIKFPKKAEWRAENIFFGPAAIIKHKDPVIVKLGYNDELKTVFKGYVRNIARTTPVQIECEDEMFRLKWKENEISKKQYAGVTLRELLTGIIPAGINIVCPVMNLGKFTIENDVPPVKVLEHLAKTDGYGLKSYFQLVNEQPVLYCGLPTAHFQQYATTHAFRFNYNIIQDNIKFNSAESQELKIKAISIMPDNTRHEVEVGDPGGNIRTFNYYNKTKAEITQFANDMLLELKKDGYSGSITVFGEPYVRKADAVHLSGDEYTGQEFTYGVSEVNRTFGTGGYRQVITIERRLG